jgi:NitT/TauT family transport system ATP-binding protein
MSSIVSAARAFAAAVPLASDIVRITGVSKSFAGNGAGTPALDNVSLDVRRGSFMALVGPSGCGKTTLLNLIAGLLPPDQGTILYDGAPVRGANTRVGYLTQLDALLPWRTVLSNVALPLEIRRLPKQKRHEAAAAIIERVGLKGFERHYPGQLSGGMRKRAAIARTLIYQPETLLLDEPFSALDAQTRLMIQRQLQDIVRELGLTVVLVTHDISEAIALSDTIAVFSRRPARILETIHVPQHAARAVTRTGAGNDPISDRIWNLLAAEIDITAV